MWVEIFFIEGFFIMKRDRTLIVAGIALAISFLFFAGCDDGRRWDEYKYVESNSAAPGTIAFWLVNEFYQDAQRTTKVIIDAGGSGIPGMPSNTFKASEIDKDTFKVHALVNHYWLADAKGNVVDPLVADADRKVIDAYVIDDTTFNNLENLLARDFVQATPPYHANPHLNLKQQGLAVEEGRYLVLQLDAEREIKPDFPRYGGLGAGQAETGWIDYSNTSVPHKLDYSITPLKEFTRRITPFDGSPYTEEIKPNTHLRFVKATGKRNNNEVAAGEISPIANSFTKGTAIAIDLKGNVSVNYRLYTPPGTHAAGTIPLVVFLHGMDGQGIPDNDVAWPDKALLASLQNTGQLGASHAVLANPKTQGRYGPFFVLAPQAQPNTYSHNAAHNKAAVDAVIAANPAINPKRVYFTGTSMGGIGTTDMIIAYPGMVAAAATGPGGASGLVYDGDGIITAGGNALKDTPIWLVSTYGDDRGMDYDSGILFEDLKNANGNVRWTHFPANTKTNGGYPDTNIVYGGFGWAHSSYEPMMSDRIKTDDQYNVNTVNLHTITTLDSKGVPEAPRQGFEKNGDISYGRTAPGDTPGQTLLQWMFAQTATIGF
jgi:hypothetical protein